MQCGSGPPHPIWVGVDVADLPAIQLMHCHTAVQPTAHHAAAHQPGKELPKGVTGAVGHRQLQQDACATATWLRVPLRQQLADDARCARVVQSLPGCQQ
jgi:hypothetical protein